MHNVGPAVHRIRSLSLMRTSYAALLSAGLLLAWSGPNMAQEPASLVLSARDIGFPVIDTTISFTREAKQTYRVRFSNPLPGPEYAMLYTGLQFCAARKLATESGFDRVAVVPESDSPQSGFAVFLAPGEEASKTLDQRFANAPFGSLDLLARSCPMQLPPARQ